MKLTSSVFWSAFLMLCFGIGNLSAQTYIVTSTDGIGSGEGTIRDAIAQANAGAYDRIEFAVPNTGGTVQTIELTSGLGDLTREVTIDASTQNGYMLGQPKIKLKYTGTNLNSAFSVKADGVVIKGLEFYFPSAIAISNDYKNISILENVFAASNSVTFGLGSQSTDCLIEGNLFGVDAQDNPLGITSTLTIRGLNHIIRGNTIYDASNAFDLMADGCTVEDNRIWTSQGNALNLSGNSNSLYGNYIGQKPGVSGITNKDGIIIFGDNNIIGKKDQPNTIINNGLNGVLVISTATGNSIVYNHITNNGPVTGNYGITYKEYSNYKNPPLYSSLTSTVTDGVVTLSGTSEVGDIIHVYHNDGVQGNALWYLAEGVATNGSFSISLPDSSFNAYDGSDYVLTATSASGQTSVLSQIFHVSPCGNMEYVVQNNSNDVNVTNSLPWCIAQANQNSCAGSSNPVRITFAEPMEILFTSVNQIPDLTKPMHIDGSDLLGQFNIPGIRLRIESLVKSKAAFRIKSESCTVEALSIISNSYQTWSKDDPNVNPGIVVNAPSFSLLDCNIAGFKEGLADYFVAGGSIQGLRIERNMFGGEFLENLGSYSFVSYPQKQGIVLITGDFSGALVNNNHFFSSSSSSISVANKVDETVSDIRVNNNTFGCYYSVLGYFESENRGGISVDGAYGLRGLEVSGNSFASKPGSQKGYTAISLAEVDSALVKQNTIGVVGPPSTISTFQSPFFQNGFHLIRAERVTLEQNTVFNVQIGVKINGVLDCKFYRNDFGVYNYTPYYIEFGFDVSGAGNDGVFQDNVLVGARNYQAKLSSVSNSNLTFKKNYFGFKPNGPNGAVVSSDDLNGRGFYFLGDHSGSFYRFEENSFGAINGNAIEFLVSGAPNVEIIGNTLGYYGSSSTAQDLPIQGYGTYFNSFDGSLKFSAFNGVPNKIVNCNRSAIKFSSCRSTTFSAEISGTHIGLGWNVRPNNSHGIEVSNSSNISLKGSASSPNIIVGGEQRGIKLSDADNIVIKGTWFGATKEPWGYSPSPNQGGEIDISGSRNIRIGSVEPGKENLFVFGNNGSRRLIDIDGGSEKIQFLNNHLAGQYSFLSTVYDLTTGGNSDIQSPEINLQGGLTGVIPVHLGDENPQNYTISLYELTDDNSQLSIRNATDQYGLMVYGDLQAVPITVSDDSPGDGQLNFSANLGEFSGKLVAQVTHLPSDTSPFGYTSGFSEEVEVSPTCELLVTNNSNDVTVQGSLPWCIDQANRNVCHVATPTDPAVIRFAEPMEINISNVEQLPALTNYILIDASEHLGQFSVPGVKIWLDSPSSLKALFDIQSSHCGINGLSILSNNIDKYIPGNSNRYLGIQLYDGYFTLENTTIGGFPKSLSNYDSSPLHGVLIKNNRFGISLESNGSGGYTWVDQPTGSHIYFFHVDFSNFRMEGNFLTGDLGNAVSLEVNDQVADSVVIDRNYFGGFYNVFGKYSGTTNGISIKGSGATGKVKKVYITNNSFESKQVETSAIELVASEDCLVERNNIGFAGPPFTIQATEMFSYGLLLTGDRIDVLRNTVLNSEKGMYFYGTEDVKVQGNTIGEYSYQLFPCEIGIGDYGNNRNLLIGGEESSQKNRIIATSSVGIYFLSKNSTVDVIGNDIGFKVVGGTNPLLTYDLSGDGIKFFGYSSEGLKVKIHDNIIGGVNNGIVTNLLNISDDMENPSIEITGNQIGYTSDYTGLDLPNKGYGMSFYSRCGEHIVTSKDGSSNVIVNNALGGIYVRGSASYPRFTVSLEGVNVGKAFNGGGPKIRGNGGNGITFQNAHNVYLGPSSDGRKSTIADSEGKGIFIGGGSENITIEGTYLGSTPTAGGIISVANAGGEIFITDQAKNIRIGADTFDNGKENEFYFDHGTTPSKVVEIGSDDVSGVSFRNNKIRGVYANLNDIYTLTSAANANIEAPVYTTTNKTVSGVIPVHLSDENPATYKVDLYELDADNSVFLNFDFNGYQGFAGNYSLLTGVNLVVSDAVSGDGQLEFTATLSDTLLGKSLVANFTHYPTNEAPAGYTSPFGIPSQVVDGCVYWVTNNSQDENIVGSLPYCINQANANACFVATAEDPAVIRFKEPFKIDFTSKNNLPALQNFITIDATEWMVNGEPEVEIFNVGGAGSFTSLLKIHHDYCTVKGLRILSESNEVYGSSPSWDEGVSILGSNITFEYNALAGFEYAFRTFNSGVVDSVHNLRITNNKFGYAITPGSGQVEFYSGNGVISLVEKDFKDIVISNNSFYDVNRLMIHFQLSNSLLAERVTIANNKFGLPDELKTYSSLEENDRVMQLSRIKDLSILGNVMDNVRSGGYIGNCLNVQLKDNTFGSDTWGISETGFSAAVCENMKVSENTFLGKYTEGLRVSKMTGLVVENNLFDGTDYDGLQQSGEIGLHISSSISDGEPTDYLIQNNQLFGHSGAQVKTSTMDPAADITITNNIIGYSKLANGTILSSTGNGIEIFERNWARDDYKLTIGPGNYIAGNQLNGIDLIWSDSKNISIEGNVFGLDKDEETQIGNGENAIYLQNVKGLVNIHKDNRIFGSADAGIRVKNCFDADFRLSISDNHIGLDLDDQAYGNQLGIVVESSKNITIEKNFISGSKEGVEITGYNNQNIAIDENYFDLSHNKNTIMPYMRDAILMGGENNQVAIGANKGNFISASRDGINIIASKNSTYDIFNNQIVSQGYGRSGLFIGYDEYDNTGWENVDLGGTTVNVGGENKGNLVAGWSRNGIDIFKVDSLGLNIYSNELGALGNLSLPGGNTIPAKGFGRDVFTVDTALALTVNFGGEGDLANTVIGKGRDALNFTEVQSSLLSINGNRVGITAAGELDQEYQGGRNGLYFTGNFTGTRTAISTNNIVGHGGTGVSIFGTLKGEFVLEANQIGLVDGQAYANKGNGVELIFNSDRLLQGLEGETQVRIGGVDKGLENIISGNLGREVSIQYADDAPISILNNFIGFKQGGEETLSSAYSALYVYESDNVWIGRDHETDQVGGNYIFSNSQYDAQVQIINVDGGLFQGNFVGLNKADEVQESQAPYGLAISYSQDVLVGGENEEANAVVGNVYGGVSLQGIETENIQLSENRIFGNQNLYGESIYFGPNNFQVNKGVRKPLIDEESNEIAIFGIIDPQDPVTQAGDVIQLFESREDGKNDAFRLINAEPIVVYDDNGTLRWRYEQPATPFLGDVVATVTHAYRKGSPYGSTSRLSKKTGVDECGTVVFSFDKLCVGQPTLFTEESTGPKDASTTYTWSINGIEVGQGTTLPYQFNGKGVYTVKLEVDNGNCVKQDTKTYTLGDPLQVIGTDSYSICAGEATVLPPTTAGGSGTLKYQWSPAAGLSNAIVLNPSASPAQSTNYQLTVTDGFGCQASTAYSVGVRPRPQISFGTIQGTSCPDKEDGYVEVSISGGSGSYNTYQVNNGTEQAVVATNFTLEDLDNKTYWIAVEDANGCVGSRPAVVPYAGPTLSASSTNSSCVPGNDAQVEFTIGGANYGYGFEYRLEGSGAYPSWTAVTYGQNKEFSNIASGPDLTLEIREAKADGCQLSKELEVKTPTVNVSNQLQLGSTCGTGNNKATINVSLSKTPTSPAPTAYKYVWERKDESGQYVPFASESLEETQQIKFLNAGEYRVVVTDNQYNCSGETSFTIDEVDGFKVVPQVVKEMEPGHINALAYGAVGPFTYEWTDQDGVKRNGAEQNALPAGTYSVTVTDPAGCAVTYSDMRVRRLPRVLIETAGTNAICTGFATVVEASGTPGYVYEFIRQLSDGTSRVEYQSPRTNDETFDLSNLDPVVKLPPGTYVVRVIDINGTTDLSDPFTVEQAPARSFDICMRWTGSKRTGPRVKTNTPEPWTKPSFPKIVAQQAIDEINNQLQKCEEDQEAQMQEQFELNCLNVATLQDKMSIQYTQGLHNFELYYYDRGGNQVRYVPPKGVDDVGNNLSVAPDHTFITESDFNSIGRILRNETPDGEETHYVYSKEGFLRFAQTTEQRLGSAFDPKPANRFSYNKYDAYCRLIEVGEAYLTPSDSFALSFTPAQIADQSFPQQVNEPTYLVYDKPANWISNQGKLQRNTGCKLSYTYRVNGNGEKAYTFYSYDPHANTEWILQEVPSLGRYAVDFNYNLLTGNLKSTAFNAGQQDALYHRFKYDSENRLTRVETSRDKLVWDRDFEYSYYAHGPLKRQEIGEDLIQGLDYIYTINGAIKGLNSASLSGLDDLGGDGVTNGYLSDEFGYSLFYYQGDFDRGLTTNHNFSVGTSYSMSLDRQYYNGLVSGAIGNLRSEGLSPNGYAYVYDKNHRLRASNYYLHDGNDYASQGDILRTSYSYDANGNFINVNRFGYGSGVNALRMDNLFYNYEPLTNRLVSVSDDASLDGNFPDDIDAGQAGDNYKYNHNGDLVRDEQEGLTYVWNLYGEIDEIIPDTNSIEQKPHIRFVYDANGNRVKKIVNHRPYDENGDTLVSNYEDITVTSYVNDVSGNTLAIYERTDRVLDTNSPNQLTATVKLLEGSLYGEKIEGLWLPNEFVASFDYRREDYEDVFLLNQQNWRRVTENTNLFSASQENVVIGGNLLTNQALYHWNYDETNATFSRNLVLELTADHVKTAVAESLTGELKFTAVIGDGLLGNDDACLLLNANNELLTGTDAINTDGQTNPVFVKRPGDSEQFVLVTRGADQKLYGHIVDPSLPADQALIQSNITLDQEGASFGSSLQAYEDYVQEISHVYAVREVSGGAELVAFTFEENILSQNPEVLSNYQGKESLAGSELQLDSTGNTLGWLRMKESTPWFDYYQTDFVSIPLGVNHLRASGVGAPELKTTQVQVLDQSSGTSLPLFKESGFDWGRHDGKAYLTAKFPVVASLENGAVTKTALIFLDQEKDTSQVLEADVWGGIRRTKDGLITIADETQGILAYEEMEDGMLSVQNAQNFSVAGADGYAYSLSLQPHRLYLEAKPLTRLAYRNIGDKLYEINDHAGNVRTVITDRRLATVSKNGSGTNILLNAVEVESFSNYYPFGMLVNGRSNVGSGGYRYGMKGMEKDDELKGAGNSYVNDRLYDPRLGRWLLRDNDPSLYIPSTYSAFNNNPNESFGFNEYGYSPGMLWRNHQLTAEGFKGLVKRDEFSQETGLSIDFHGRNVLPALVSQQPIVQTLGYHANLWNVENSSVIPDRTVSFNGAVSAEKGGAKLDVSLTPLDEVTRFKIERFTYVKFEQLVPLKTFPSKDFNVKIEPFKIRLPKIRLPRIRLPKIRLPIIRLPKIKLPQIFKSRKVKCPDHDKQREKDNKAQKRTMKNKSVEIARGKKRTNSSKKNNSRGKGRRAGSGRASRKRGATKKK